MKSFLALTAFLFCAVPALASPPTDVKLSYDEAKGVLHISARHPSERMQRYFIRRAAISRNGVQEQVVTYVRQTLPAGLEDDVEFKAEPGDVISVELLASEGGTGSGELTLPPKPKAEAKK